VRGPGAASGVGSASAMVGLQSRVSTEQCRWCLIAYNQTFETVSANHSNLEVMFERVADSVSRIFEYGLEI
jgi:hypothetical protein